MGAGPSANAWRLHDWASAAAGRTDCPGSCGKLAGRYDELLARRDYPLVGLRIQFSMSDSPGDRSLRARQGDERADRQRRLNRLPPGRRSELHRALKPATILRIVLALLIVAAVVVGLSVLPVKESLAVLLRDIEAVGPWGPVLLAGAYAIACVLFVPGSILTLGTGFLFGVFQGIFVRKQTFQELGGFPALPVMEDFEFVRRLRRRGRIWIASLPVITSGRRWRELGIWRTTWINQRVILGYCLGVSPERLAAWYARRAK